MKTEEQKKKAREYAKNYREKNIEKAREYAREKYAKNKDKHKEWNRRRKHDNPAKWLLWIATSRAKKNSIEISISEEDIIVPEVCPILGIKIAPNDGAVCSSSLSLDRKDPSKGYVPGNVFVISHRANNLKRDMTISQLKALLKYMEE